MVLQLLSFRQWVVLLADLGVCRCLYQERIAGWVLQWYNHLLTDLLAASDSSLNLQGRLPPVHLPFELDIVVASILNWCII